MSGVVVGVGVVVVVVVVVVVFLVVFLGLGLGLEVLGLIKGPSFRRRVCIIPFCDFLSNI